MRKSNRKVMAGIAVMTLAAACMVTGCGKKDEKKEDKPGDKKIEAKKQELK